MENIDYNSVLKEYDDRLYDPDIGLTSDDYIELVQLLQEIKSQHNEENNEYLERVKELLNLLLKSGVATGLSYSNYRYVLDELSPLPFVFANRSNPDSLKSYEYFRATQFKFYNVLIDYDIKTVTMLLVKNGRVQQIDFVNDIKVSSKSLSNVEYVMGQEKITFKEALLVLLGVYNCKISINNKKLSDIINKYQEVLKSKEYLNFLLEAINYSKENNTYGDEQIEFYRKRLNERYIVEKDKVNPNYKYQTVPKMLVLERK